MYLWGFLPIPSGVSMAAFILSQVFGLITLVFVFWALQIKDQRKYLLINSIGSVFWMVMFILGGSLITPILVAIFSFARGFVFWWILKEDTPKRRKMGKTFLYVSLVVALGGAIFALVQTEPQYIIFEVILLVTAVLFIIGQYLPSKHYLRIFSVFYAVAMLLASSPLARVNYMAMIIEAGKMLSVVVFYLFYVKIGAIRKQVINYKNKLAVEMSSLAKINQEDISQLELVEGRIEKIACHLVSLQIKLVDHEKLHSKTSYETETCLLIQQIENVRKIRASLKTIKTLEANI
jgi:hypothetical protein